MEKAAKEVVQTLNSIGINCQASALDAGSKKQILDPCNAPEMSKEVVETFGELHSGDDLVVDTWFWEPDASLTRAPAAVLDQIKKVQQLKEARSKAGAQKGKRKAEVIEEEEEDTTPRSNRRKTVTTTATTTATTEEASEDTPPVSPNSNALTEGEILNDITQSIVEDAPDWTDKLFYPHNDSKSTYFCFKANQLKVSQMLYRLGLASLQRRSSNTPSGRSITPRAS